MENVKIYMNGINNNSTQYIKDVMLGKVTLEVGEFKVVLINEEEDFKWEYNACGSGDGRFDENILIVIEDTVVYADHNFGIKFAEILKKDSAFCVPVKEFIEHKF